jgi:hypothetical protein
MEADSLPTAEQKPPKPRWFHPTPGWLLVGLLAVEGLLLLSERFCWFPFNQHFNQHKGWTVLLAISSVGVFLFLMLLWFVASVILRWRFQFSLRSLLVLTVAVAIPFSWLGVEMKKAREQREAVEWVRKMGGTVFYNPCRDPGTVIPVSPVPHWLWDFFGDDFFGNVYVVFCDDTNVRDVDLERFRGMTKLMRLSLEHTQVTKKGINELQEALPNCEMFH